MTFNFVKNIFPSWQNALLAVLAAGLLILAFPDFEYWPLAWFALVPLMFAVEREKARAARSFMLGWIFGTVFFFGTCWWLTFAPITYAGFPPWLAYSGMVFVALAVGIFPAIFAGVMSVFLRRFGSWGFLAAPFVWVFTEFLRYWLTGNNWNAVGYSQAFSGFEFLASVGGVLVVSGLIVAVNSIVVVPLGEFLAYLWDDRISNWNSRLFQKLLPSIIGAAFLLGLAVILMLNALMEGESTTMRSRPAASVIAIQPNVPMSGLDFQKWNQFRQHQIDSAESAIRTVDSQLPTANRQLPTLVILPESPMNFMYNDDREFQHFIGDFARRNNVSVLFNSAEPDATNGKYFNSAVMVGPDGREIGEYDKIYLLPFGEAVPPILEGLVPGFVGNFSYGREYDLFPVGDAKAGVMICFESHFGQLSREYVRNGADMIIEMTNDGYLGPTPVLRQHLASAVFRAVETNRPVLRVTNVGITAYINEKGAVLDPTSVYQEDTRIWSVSKSDGSQTFYVKYGDWFAWLCSAVTIWLLIVSFWRRRAETRV